MLLHEHAIYMHEGQQYQVEKLDFSGKKAYVLQCKCRLIYGRRFKILSVKVLDVLKEQPLGEGNLCLWRGTGYMVCIMLFKKKFKLDTQETLGFGPVDLS